MDDNAAERLAILARYKQMACRHCGKPITVSVRTRKPPAHIECSISASMEAARQMREKKGPYYDRWLVSMRKIADGETWGGVGEDKTGG